MATQTGFRVFGEILGRQESYLDVTVSGIDENGVIYLQESGGDETEWEFTASEISDLHKDLLIVGLDNLPFPNHKLWKTLETVGENRAEIDINNFVDDNLRKSQKSLFKAILEAGR